MTTEELEAIAARAAAATPGPWIGGRAASLLTPRFVYEVAYRRDLEARDSWTAWEHNAEFIAHTREDIPALLAEVERLQVALREIVSMDIGRPDQLGFCTDCAEMQRLARGALRT